MRTEMIYFFETGFEKSIVLNGSKGTHYVCNPKCSIFHLLCWIMSRSLT